MSYECGHCGERRFTGEAHPCSVCGRSLCQCQCRQPCPDFVKLKDRVAELETKMQSLDDRLNIPGLPEKAARQADQIPEAQPEYS